MNLKIGPACWNTSKRLNLLTRVSLVGWYHAILLGLPVGFLSHSMIGYPESWINYLCWLTLIEREHKYNIVLVGIFDTSPGHLFSGIWFTGILKDYISWDKLGRSLIGRWRIAKKSAPVEVLKDHCPKMDIHLTPSWWQLPRSAKLWRKAISVQNSKLVTDS